MRSIRRPNVLLLYTDQQRQDSLGCYGNHLALTPNLDKLAAEGARFDNYFVQNPVCTPSRMSFLTGRYCSSLGIGTNGPVFPEDAVPVNQLLKPYGYHTAQIGKLHFQPHSRRDHRNPHPDYGFDVFILSDEPGCYDDAYIKWVETIDPEMVARVRVSLPPAAEAAGGKAYSDVPRNTHEPYIFEGDEDLTHSAFVASEMCGFLEKQKQDRPFFAIAGFYAPHAPVNPPGRFAAMYNPKDMPLPRLGREESFAPPLQEVAPEKWQEIAACYMALVSHVDDCIGKILDTLKKTGLAEDTIVIFTSDHGEYLGDHGRVQKGPPGHDCIIRMPFLIRYPERIKPGTVLDVLAEGVDFVPTLLDYCGIQTPGFVQGKSFKALLEGKADTHREDILMEVFQPRGHKTAAVRTKDFKYCCSNDGKELLYDLRQDPKELENVAGKQSYRDVLLEMTKRMNSRLMDAALNCRDRDAEY